MYASLSPPERHFLAETYEEKHASRYESFQLSFFDFADIEGRDGCISIKLRAGSAEVYRRAGGALYIGKENDIFPFAELRNLREGGCWKSAVVGLLFPLRTAERPAPVGRAYVDSSEGVAVSADGVLMADVAKPEHGYAVQGRRYKRILFVPKKCEAYEARDGLLITCGDATILETPNGVVLIE